MEKVNEKEKEEMEEIEEMEENQEQASSQNPFFSQNTQVSQPTNSQVAQRHSRPRKRNRNNNNNNENEQLTAAEWTSALVNKEYTCCEKECINKIKEESVLKFKENLMQLDKKQKEVYIFKYRQFFWRSI